MLLLKESQASFIKQILMAIGNHYQAQHQVISEDINNAARENSLKKCMRENTWEWIRVD